MSKLIEKEPIAETLLNLQTEFDSPITYTYILTKFNAINDNTPEVFISFSLGFVQDVVRNVNIKFLLQLNRRLINAVTDLEPLNFHDFKVDSEMSAQDFGLIIQNIYTKVSNNQGYKEEIAHYNLLFKEAINCLSSLKGSFTSFFMDPDIMTGILSKQDRQKRLNNIINDIDIYIKKLKDTVSSLTNLSDKVISARLDLLKRVDSSIRLLTKHIELEYGINHGFSKRLTTPPGGPNSGFDVESVES